MPTGWYLDNFWLCRMGVRTVSWCNARQMLPVQDAQAALSWREPTGIHGSISHYIQYIPVYTSTYWYVLGHTSMYCHQYLLLHISTYWYVLVCTSTWCTLVHTSMYWYIPLCTCTYFNKYVLVHTSTYLYVLVCTSA